MTPQVVSVGEFIGILNETLGFAFPSVVVEGEVASFKVNQGKWVFFDLKDQDATLACFMAVHQLKVPLEDGMRVRVTGVPKLTKWGKFSFTVRSVELAGEGELRRAFELLKAKLTTEGLFAADRKRALPRYPRQVGLITSGQSAAYSDFVKILDSRWGGVNVLLADVTVQGASAADQVVAAISYFNQLSKPADVLVIIRGGGSLEDLQAFSTEAVARAVAASRTPTLVGVGHEVDVSLADYAADMRAATPTDAARLVVPERREVLGEVLYRRETIRRRLERQQLELVNRLRQDVDRLAAFVRAPREAVMSAEARLRRAFDRLDAAAKQSQLELQIRRHSLQQNFEALVQARSKEVESTLRLLRGASPEAVLARGYAIVRHGQTIVRRASEVQPGDRLMIQLHQDSISSEVTKP